MHEIHTEQGNICLSRVLDLDTVVKPITINNAPEHDETTPREIYSRPEEMLSALRNTLIQDDDGF